MEVSAYKSGSSPPDDWRGRIAPVGLERIALWLRYDTRSMGKRVERSPIYAVRPIFPAFSQYIFLEHLLPHRSFQI